MPPLCSTCESSEFFKCSKWNVIYRRNTKLNFGTLDHPHLNVKKITICKVESSIPFFRKYINLKFRMSQHPIFPPLLYDKVQIFFKFDKCKVIFIRDTKLKLRMSQHSFHLNATKVRFFEIWEVQNLFSEIVQILVVWNVTGPPTPLMTLVRTVAVCILISPTDSLDIDRLTYCHMNMH